MRSCPRRDGRKWIAAGSARFLRHAASSPRGPVAAKLACSRCCWPAPAGPVLRAVLRKGRSARSFAAGALLTAVPFCCSGCSRPGFVLGPVVSGIVRPCSVRIGFLLRGWASVPCCPGPDRPRTVVPLPALIVPGSFSRRSDRPPSEPSSAWSFSPSLHSSPFLRSYCSMGRTGVVVLVPRPSCS